MMSFSGPSFIWANINMTNGITQMNQNSSSTVERIFLQLLAWIASSCTHYHYQATPLRSEKSNALHNTLENIFEES